MSKKANNKKAADTMTIQEAGLYNRELHIDLWYPDVETADVKMLTIGLMDVRASDDIRISYDKKRDGWKIEKLSKLLFLNGILMMRYVILTGKRLLL
ncbi:MAG: hypothetical protein JRI26_13340 [Deltaproteobacteria bacterium]|nr:hypothetical protein [Deltaproteobacteria bacterium]